VALGARLIEAIATQDEASIEACFADDAQFRALTPKGVRERQGPVETASLISAWFADSTELDLVDSSTGEVGARLHISYRFQGVEAGERYVVEQHLYCTVRDGLIQRADLLCSGFLPRAAESLPAAGP
jgi:hypothetical protein